MSHVLVGVGGPTDVDDAPVAPGVVGPRTDAIGAGIDIAAVVIAAAMFVLLVTDSSVVVRPVVALVFAVFVPGWVLLRCCGAPASLLTAAGATTASVAAIMLIGQGLVLFGDWKWFPAGLLLAAASIALGVTSLRRRPLTGGWGTGRATRTTPVPRRNAAVALGSVTAGNILIAYGVRHTQIRANDLLGLVDVLSAWYWLGVAVIVAGLLAGLRSATRWVWCNVVALMVALHGLPGMLEPSPRFSVAWLHVGFIRHVAEHGTLLKSLDARFSWAGFFTGGGFLQRLGGTESVLWLVRYAPLYYNALTIVLIVCLARRLGCTANQAAVAATLFCCLNWIGQDYFAPQATAFVLYLTVITVVLHVFPSDPAAAPHWIRRLLRPAPDATVGLHGRAAAGVLAGCYVVALAMVVSHQLTPGFLMMALVLLALCGATRARLLPLVVVVLFIVWLSLGGQAYWSGHFGTITNSVGQVGSIVDNNVAKRTGSTDLKRQVVVNGRIALALVAWAAAGVSIIVQWWRRRTPVVLVCLLAAPFPMIALQPYGGEMILRVCYFSLPAVVILVAQLLPRTARLSGRTIGVLAVALAVLIPTFVLTRYGNESFEAMSQDDADLNRAMYRIVPDGSIVFVPSRQGPIYSERIDQVRFRNLPVGSVEAANHALEAVAKRSSVFILFTESQSAYGVTSSGRDPQWLSTLIEEYLHTGHYEIEAQIGRGALLRWRNG